jgi:hypothetical protein
LSIDASATNQFVQLLRVAQQAKKSTDTHESSIDARATATTGQLCALRNRRKKAPIARIERRRKATLQFVQLLRRGEGCRNEANHEPP